MQRLLSFLLTVAALFTFLSLPSLWLAWDPSVLLRILASGIGAAIVYMLLYPFSDMSKPPGHA